VPSEAALLNLARRVPAEGHTHPLQRNNCRWCFFRKNLCHVLVGEVVTAFYGVEHVPVPAVFFLVSEARRDSALSRNRMRTCNVDFADDGDSAVLSSF
jgi:hypothetical protein